MHAADLDAETLVRCLADFRDDCSIQPDYDLDSLTWLLSFMERMHVRENLRKTVVRDDGQRIVGWYIYHLKPGDVAQVVQIGGQARFTKDILDCLFHDAWSRGAIALHGVLPSHMMGDFTEKNCFFTCRGGWTMAHSRNPQLLELLDHHDASLSRLDGEWCLNFND